MGTIIHLNPQQRAVPPVTTGEVLPECEIVIFPGVRIERHETPFIADAPGPEVDEVHRGHRPRKSS